MNHKDIQEGDAYYFPVDRSPDKYIMLKMTSQHVRVQRVSNGHKTFTTMSNWEQINKEGYVVLHKDLIDIYGEEAIFQHTLADTLEDLLDRYKEIYNDL